MFYTHIYTHVYTNTHIYAYCFEKVTFELREEPAKEPGWSEIMVKEAGAR